VNITRSHRLFLVSNSTNHGGTFLSHCIDAISEFLTARVDTVLFVPFALADHEAYAQRVRSRMETIGKNVESLHEAGDAKAAVTQAQAVFVGGGNTFRLLRALYELEVLDAIRMRAAAGMPYLGSSAGTNLACPTIRTTNDMPIVEPQSFDALGLVPFQINPHYVDADPDSRHMGETRRKRIEEFHEENDTPVLGMREGAWLVVTDGTARLAGENGAVLFNRGAEPEEIASGATVYGGEP
jgi:dipeptidase E